MRIAVYDAFARLAAGMTEEETGDPFPHVSELDT